MNNTNQHPCVTCQRRKSCKNNKGCIDYLEYSLFVKDCKESIDREKKSGMNQYLYEKKIRKINTNTYLNAIGKTLDEALKLNIRLDDFGMVVK